MWFTALCLRPPPKTTKGLNSITQISSSYFQSALKSYIMINFQRYFLRIRIKKNLEKESLFIYSFKSHLQLLYLAHKKVLAERFMPSTAPALMAKSSKRNQ